MAVKIVQGLIGDQQAATKAKLNTQTTVSSSASQTALVSSTVAQHANTEAVNVSVRTLRSSSAADRIKDPKEAKDVAERVADSIRDEPESIGAHEGLSSASGHSHLAQ